MGLLRTILGFVMLLILVHTGLVYSGFDQDANALTAVIFSLGALLEAPATLILGALGSRLPDFINPDSFLTVALTALVVYMILYTLLGFGQD